MSADTSSPILSESLLRRHDVAGPRYTSYPTADRFVETFGAAQYEQALTQRARAARAGSDAALSVYVHIPFCAQLCYYCACNKVVTRHHEQAGEYLKALQRELELQLAVLGTGQALTQLHFGGGTPTFMSDTELTSLMALLRRSFSFRPDAELSIEVDPRTVDAQRLAHLKTLGLNRLSFGVQDFDPDVQQAVHRVQPFDSVRTLMHSAREIGFDSINVDLIYGLPRQTPQSFDRTIAQVAGLRPDRIALYAYAHLPQRFKPQRRILSSDLPPPGDRVQMLGAALAGFLDLGYAHIGMDHFALHGDALAAAKREGRLHRNFQGYSTQPDCDLIALGVSAIGKIGPTFSQNVKTLGPYYDALNQGQLPIERGLALNRDDLLRRDVIMALMCQGRVDFATIEAVHGVLMQEAFAAELERLEPLAEQGFVEIEPRAVQVTALGWYFVRAVAMVFDRYLNANVLRERFSRII
ncbi:MAG: oxygen-independent coproporphyrinogen III oxidase [Burkholderiaceae bacterium]